MRVKELQKEQRRQFLCWKLEGFLIEHAFVPQLKPVLLFDWKCLRYHQRSSEKSFLHHVFISCITYRDNSCFAKFLEILCQSRWCFTKCLRWVLSVYKPLCIYNTEIYKEKESSKRHFKASSIKSTELLDLILPLLWVDLSNLCLNSRKSLIHYHLVWKVQNTYL